MTISELSKLSGVDKRTIDYYSAGKKGGGAGLLLYTESKEDSRGHKYRCYDDKALERLWRIRLYHEMGYSIEQIKGMIDDPAYLLAEELDRQIARLKDKKEREIKRLDDMIRFANSLRTSGLSMAYISRHFYSIPLGDFMGPFTDAMKRMSADLEASPGEWERLARALRAFLKAVCKLRDRGHDSEEVQREAGKLHNHFNDCVCALAFYVGSKFLEAQAVRELAENELDQETFEAILEALQICNDWMREARTLDRISDMKAFRESRRERAAKMDEKYGEVGSIEGLAELIRDFCGMVRETGLGLPALAEELRVRGDMATAIDGEYGEGSSGFIADAIEFFCGGLKEGGNDCEGHL